MATDELTRIGEDLEQIEIQLLLEGIFRHYGYDFRGYAPGSLKRRLWHRAIGEKVDSISALQEKVLHDPEVMERLLLDLSINVTSMFRDPTFYVGFRQKVVPLMRTYPFVRIWNAGCSTGEETYSLAILLREEGVYEKSRIYATDINDSVLERAPLQRLAADGQLRAHRHEGFWECMDTYKDAVVLNDLWASGEAPWRLWG